MDAQEITSFVDAQLRQPRGAVYGFMAPRDFVLCSECSHNWHGLKCPQCGLQNLKHHVGVFDAVGYREKRPLPER